MIKCTFTKCTFKRSNIDVAYILAEGTRSCCIIMGPKLVVALLTYTFSRFDVVRVMAERAESVKAACDNVCKSRTHNN